jgi:hypothetical protein
MAQMARSSLRAPVVGGAADRHPLRRSTTAVVQLVTSSLLVFAIAIAAFAISTGFARAQVVGTMHEPDTGLVLGLFALAIVLMGVLSAAAVRFAGRTRR